MGFNTAVVLFNDQTDKWPRDMLQAMQEWSPKHLRKNPRQGTGYFGWGQIISTAHADEQQVSVVSRNHGDLIAPMYPAGEQQLEALATVLRAHGYSVKAPNEKRARPPLYWGYWARHKDAP